MTRRSLLCLPASLLASTGTMSVPIQHIFDTRANASREQLDRFRQRIWPEAVNDFSRCGIQFQTKLTESDVGRSPAGSPIIRNLDRAAINLVITRNIPLRWGRGRGVTGVTTQIDGCPVCMIALDFAHTHEIPFFSVNTCVHELLHVLTGDVFERRPKGLSGAMREARIDAYATRLWLFHDGAEIRRATNLYLNRLRAY